MKRIFTRTAFTVMFFALLSAALNSNAQTLASAEKLEKKATTDAVTTKADNKTVKSDSSATQTTDAKATTAKPADDNWKPTRRIWGYTFGDFYYKAHGDPLNRGGSNQYTGINQYRNGFQFRRIYLGYDYDINKKFSAELLLAAEDNFATNSINGSTASTSGDLLTDNKFSFYIKLMNIRIHDLWKGTDLVVGQVATPAFPMLTEKVWGYRDVERTVSDIRRTPSYDLGAALQGTFDPDTKNFGYDVMVGNGSSAKPENDIYKWFYGDIWAKALDKKLMFDLYADYEQLTPNTAAAPMTSRNMIKGYVAYSVPTFTAGVEAFTNLLKNGAQITNGASKTFEDQTATAVSMYVHGFFTPALKFGYFARLDIYNPDTKYDATKGTYKGLVGNYDPNTKEHFVTAGLDFQPSPNIHFMPNIWWDQYTANTNLSQPTNHDLVYRVTFFFQFGK